MNRPLLLSGVLSVIAVLSTLVATPPWMQCAVIAESPWCDDLTLSQATPHSRWAYADWGASTVRKLPLIRRLSTTAHSADANTDNNVIHRAAVAAAAAAPHAVAAMTVAILDSHHRATVLRRLGACFVTSLTLFYALLLSTKFPDPLLTHIGGGPRWTDLGTGRMEGATYFVVVASRPLWPTTVATTSLFVFFYARRVGPWVRRLYLATAVASLCCIVAVRVVYSVDVISAVLGSTVVFVLYHWLARSEGAAEAEWQSAWGDNPLPPNSPMTIPSMRSADAPPLGPSAATTTTTAIAAQSVVTGALIQLERQARYEPAWVSAAIEFAHVRAVSFFAWFEADVQAVAWSSAGTGLTAAATREQNGDVLRRRTFHDYMTLRVVVGEDEPQLPATTDRTSSMTLSTSRWGDCDFQDDEDAEVPFDALNTRPVRDYGSTQDSSGMGPILSSAAPSTESWKRASRSGVSVGTAPDAVEAERHEKCRAARRLRRFPNATWVRDDPGGSATVMAWRWAAVVAALVATMLLMAAAIAVNVAAVGATDAHRPLLFAATDRDVGSATRPKGRSGVGAAAATARDFAPLPDDPAARWLPTVPPDLGDWMVRPVTFFALAAVVASPHRLPLLRRLVGEYALVMLLRACTLVSTFPPDPSPFCLTAVHDPLLTCGDMIFSGHSVALLLSSVYFAECLGHARALKLYLWLYTLAALVAIVASKLHYTRDVATAAVVVFAVHHLLRVTVYERPDVVVRHRLLRAWEVDAYVDLKLLCCSAGARGDGWLTFAPISPFLDRG